MARSSAPCTHRLVQVGRAGHEGVSTGHIHDPQWRYDLTTPIFRGVPGNIVALAHLCAGANGGHGSPRRRIESFSPLPRALATAAPMMATSCANVLERTAPHIASGHHLAVLPEARSTLGAEDANHRLPRWWRVTSEARDGALPTTSGGRTVRGMDNGRAGARPSPQSVRAPGWWRLNPPSVSGDLRG